MKKKNLLKAGIMMGIFSVGLIAGKGENAQAASQEKPTIVGEERIVYLGGKDIISVQGERIVSIKYTSANKKVAVVSKKGVVTPKKKGKTRICAKVTYCNSADGKTYTSQLSYPVKVLGKAQEYFTLTKSAQKTYCIKSLTVKGKKQKKLYIPSYAGSHKVTEMAQSVLYNDDKVEEVHFGDNMKGKYTPIRCSKLKKIYLGKSYAPSQFKSALFAECPCLEEIIVDSRNSNLKMVDGVLFSADGKRLYCYPAKKSGTSYRIPEKTEIIEENAFDGSSLAEITFCNDVVTCESYAFRNCTALQKIQLPKNLHEIKSGMFEGCTSLTSFEISANVVYISTYAFQGCNKLTDFTVSSSNSNYSSVNGVLYSKDKKILEYCPRGRKAASYTVDAATEEISSLAFAECKNLEKVILPEKIKVIGERAFSASGIRSVEIPDKIEDVEIGAFSQCKNLSSVKLSRGQKRLEDQLFYGCTSLKEITIPKEIDRLRMRVFEGCSNLEKINVEEGNKDFTSIDGILYSKNEVVLYCYPAGKSGTSFNVPKKVQKIATAAFVGVSGLKKIYIPDKVWYIGTDAFIKCRNLEEIRLPKEVRSGDSSFEGCRSLKKITLPKGVNVLQARDFVGCSALEKVVLPDTVTQIGGKAFKGCKKLKEVVLGKRLKHLGAQAFANCESLKKITIKSTYVTAGSVRTDVFKRAGAKNYKKLVIKVPSGRKKKYQKIFYKAGLSKLVKFK